MKDELLCVAPVCPDGCSGLHFVLTPEFISRFQHESVLQDWARVGWTVTIMSMSEALERQKKYDTCTCHRHFRRDNWRIKKPRGAQRRKYAIANHVIKLIQCMKALSD